MSFVKRLKSQLTTLNLSKFGRNCIAVMRKNIATEQFKERKLINTEETKIVNEGMVTKKLPHNVVITYWEKDENKLEFKIDGENIKVKIGKLLEPWGSGKISVNIYAKDTTVVLEDNCWVSQYLTIFLGQNHPNFGKISNTNVFIGKNCSVEGCVVITYNSNCNITIGADSMISFGVTIYNTDAHPFYDSKTGKLLNKVKDLSIGSHCWIGANATILKNVEIPPGSIIGWGAVVNKGSLKNLKGFSSPSYSSGIILSGNPASIVRGGVSWSSNGSKGYVQNE